MHPDDQDIIDDFLLEIAERGLALRGQLLMNLIKNAINGSSIEPNEQDVAERVPAELLKMAKKWRTTGIIELGSILERASADNK